VKIFYTEGKRKLDFSDGQKKVLNLWVISRFCSVASVMVQKGQVKWPFLFLTWAVGYEFKEEVLS
jgi:hypothetical protein